MRKFIPILILVTFTSIFIFFFGVQSLTPVNAQCGTSSSCSTCHQVQGLHPVNTTGDWHIDHADNDLCADCHKGNAAASDQLAAHTGTTINLVDMGLSCQNCHPDDYVNFYAKYAAELGISTIPQIASQNPLNGISSALCVTPAAVSPTGNPAVRGAGNTPLFIVLGAAVLLAGAFIFWNEKRRSKSRKEKK